MAGKSRRSTAGLSFCLKRASLLSQAYHRLRRPVNWRMFKEGRKLVTAPGCVFQTGGARTISDVLLSATFFGRPLTYV